MMLCVMMLLPWSSSGLPSSSLSVSVTTTASGVDVQPPDYGEHIQTGLFTLRERLITMRKQLEGAREYNVGLIIDGGCPVSLTLGAIIVSNTHALPAEYKCLSNKTEQSIYECLLGFCLYIFCAATNFGCIDGFLLPNSRNGKWWVMVSLVLLLPVCLNE